MGRYLSVLLVLGSLLASATPAAAQSRREMQMMADIRMLQEQTQQLQQQLQTALAQLTEALKAINGRIDEQANATRKAFADQKLTVDSLSGDLRVVRERVDDTNVRIGSLSQEVEALRLAIPQTPAPGMMPPTEPSPPGTTGPPTAGTPSGVPAPTPALPPPTPTPLGPGVSPQRMYDTAWADYTAGQWALCREGFSQFVRTFPRSDQADNAQWYVGDCYFSEGKFTEAIEAYNQVITNYPRGDAVPSAYYKRGLAFDRLGQIDRARESFEQVLKNFPDSDAATLAKQNLDRINRGKPRG